MPEAPSAGFSLPERYRLDGPVAAGGMAAVYAAHDQLLDRPVAVKVLAEHLNADVAARERFQREARAAASLSSHPSVVTVFDVGEHEGRSFIVMELRNGGTLADAIRRSGRVEGARALAWLRQTAEALDVAHDAGIVHRDIKPANLLLDEHDRVAVADFGIARLAWEQQVTQTGQVLGTAAYLAPEQAEGRNATAASDRYALAVVAFELLTGTRPFQAEHFAAQARAHIEDPPPAATERAPELPQALDAVFERALAKDPDARWPSAAAFVDALERAFDGAGDPQPTPTRVMAAGVAANGHAPPAAAAPVAAAPPRRNWLLIGAVALLLLIAGLAIAGAVTDGGEEGAQRPDEPEATATREPERTPRAEKTPRPTPTATQEAQSTPAAPAGGNPAQLNDQGFALFQNGQYAESIPYFERAVEACGDSLEDTCAYATYNLGAALHRAGRSAEAIPILQRRLERWPDNQPEVVEAELAAACEAAGQDCGSAAGDDGPGNGKGKGKGKGRGKSDDD